MVRANPYILPLTWFRDEFMVDEVHSRIVSMVKRGYTIDEVAMTVGVSSRAVVRLKARVAKTGSPAVSTFRKTREPFGKLNPEKVMDLRFKRAAGWTYTELGRHFGIARTSARDAALGFTWSNV